MIDVAVCGVNLNITSEEQVIWDRSLSMDELAHKVVDNTKATEEKSLVMWSRQKSMETCTKQMLEGIPQDKVLVHTIHGCKLMERAKWPKLLTPEGKDETQRDNGFSHTYEEERGEQEVQDARTVNSELAKGKTMKPDMVSREGSDTEAYQDKVDCIDSGNEWMEIEEDWVKQKKQKRIRKTLVRKGPIRQSNRIQLDGVHMLEKAQGLTRKKNLEEGNSSKSNNLNSFTILNDCCISDLENIASSCGIDLNNNQEGVINAMLAEENLRAATAEAAYVVRQEQIIERLNTLESENLNLGWIDNIERVVQVETSGTGVFIGKQKKKRLSKKERELQRLKS